MKIVGFADADIDARGLQRAVGRLLGTEHGNRSAGLELVLGAGDIHANLSHPSR